MRLHWNGPALAVLFAACAGRPSKPAADRSARGAAKARVSGLAGVAGPTAPGLAVTLAPLAPSFSFGRTPRFRVTLANGSARPLSVYHGAGDRDGPLYLTLAPAAHPDRYVGSPVTFGRAEAIHLAPGASWSFGYPPRGVDATREVTDESLLPGRYLATLLYQADALPSDASFIPDLRFAADQGALAGKSATDLFHGRARSAAVPFAVTSDGSRDLAAAEAAYHGTGLGTLRLHLVADRTTARVGESCQVEGTVENAGSVPLTIDDCDWGLREVDPRDAAGESLCSGVLTLAPHERRGGWGWSVTRHHAGAHGYYLLYAPRDPDAPASAHVRSNTVTITFR